MMGPKLVAYRLVVVVKTPEKVGWRSHKIDVKDNYAHAEHKTDVLLK